MSFGNDRKKCFEIIKMIPESPKLTPIFEAHINIKKRGQLWIIRMNYQNLLDWSCTIITKKISFSFLFLPLKSSKDKQRWRYSPQKPYHTEILGKNQQTKFKYKKYSKQNLTKYPTLIHSQNKFLCHLKKHKSQRKRTKALIKIFP